MYTFSYHSLLLILSMVVMSFVLAGCTVKHENINDYNLVEKTYLVNFTPVVYGLPKIKPQNTIRFYIEGDGRAWINKYHPSYDPTPSNSLILKLMQEDNIPAVYLARPCQYKQNDSCKQYYWTEGRHAAKLVDVMNDTISNIKQKYSAKNIELIGHSGGGTMAVLIASKRSDVKRIITIAANLDVKFFTKYHKVTLMQGSLNPIDVFNEVKYIPQLHLAGGEDKMVPPFLIKRYIHEGNSACVHYKEYPENSHHKGWLNVWPNVLKQNISCD